jgi:outer membrane protein assembly factor BamD (BamD/ComL family)
MTRALVLLALLSLSACSTTTTTWTRISSSVEASRLIREANGQLRDGNPAAAARILDDAVRRFPDASGHDQALYDLARALVLSANGGRDYRQASAHLDRLLREYPTSSYVSDARALRIALGAYVARSAELDRLLERLRAIDLEYERPRQP